MIVFAKIFYSMMGSQKRIGKKLKGEGNLDSDVKVRRCGLGDGPKRFFVLLLLGCPQKSSYCTKWSRILLLSLKYLISQSCVE